MKTGIFIILTALIFSSVAFASAPPKRAKGKLYFYQHQGNYCPANRDCSGAKYQQSQHHTYQPIRDGKVYIRRKDNGAILGQGVVNSVGEFNMLWTDSEAGGVAVWIEFQAEHKDGIFRVATGNGGHYIYRASTYLQQYGTTDIGIVLWGTPTAPNAIMNLYDGARRMWRYSLSQSNRMHHHFNGLEILAFDSDCPTSCARGRQKEIVIDSPGSAYRPSARILHEMGHVASTQASKRQRKRSASLYGYPSKGLKARKGGWNYSSPEWGAPQFEEAIATHFGDVALFYPSAATPGTCNSTGPCSANLEPSEGPACSMDERRAPIQAMRYFWDIYDSNKDFFGETLSAPVWQSIDTLYAFGNGSKDNDKNEPFRAALITIDDPDGRSTIDFEQLWVGDGDTNRQLLINCGGIGD